MHNILASSPSVANLDYLSFMRGSLNYIYNFQFTGAYVVLMHVTLLNY